VLFGSTFVVVQDAVRDVDVLPFLVVRFGFAALALAPAVVRRRRSLHLWRHGAAAGVALGAGYVFQTLGLQHTTTSVSAFLTYLLVVIVPLLSAVVLRRPPRAATLAGVAIAVVGLAFLSGGGVSFGRGEALTIVCAVAFAVHIVVLADVAPHHDVLALCGVQFALVVVVLAPVAASTGSFAFPASAWWAAVYTGLAVSVAGFGLQVWGQRRVSASRAALVLMLEPVVAAVLGRWRGEHLGALGWFGAVLILAGILVSELAPRVD